MRKIETVEKGTRIECENGHLIATANCDVTAFLQFRKESFDFNIDPTGNGSRCPTCNALYLKVLGTRQGTGIYPRNDEGEITGPEVERRRGTGLEVHLGGRGWVRFGQTGDEWLAEHPEP
jgi:hypothetical protein